MSRLSSYYKGIMKLRKFHKDISELTIFITNACNLNCQHCFYAKEINNNIQNISLADYKKLFSSLKKPLLNINITGGEPFLERNIVEIIKELSVLNNPWQITIATNGFATKEIIVKTNEILSFYQGHLHLQISLDGLEKEHNEIRRNDNSFSHAIATLGELKNIVGKQGRFTIGINTTVTKQNKNQLDKIAKYVNDDLGISHNFELVRGSTFLAGGVEENILSNFNPDSEDVLVPNDKEIKTINHRLDLILFKNAKETKDIAWFFRPLFYALKSAQFYFYRFILKRAKPLKHCKAGRSMGVIYQNGDFAFCELTKVVGNLSNYDFDLYRLWNDRKIKVKTKMLRCYCTHGCFVPPTLVFYPRMWLRLIVQFFKYFVFKLIKKND